MAVKQPPMPKRILVIQGHPDQHESHLCHALAKAYTSGAEEAGHRVVNLKVAELHFPLLRMEADFNQGLPVTDIQSAQEEIAEADHLVLIYPLWLGAMPALLQGFFEQVFRPAFVFGYRDSGPPLNRLKGKSAHVFVTMGMPAFIYRWFYGAHSLKALERNLLKYCGIAPIRKTLFGGAKTASPKLKKRWLSTVRNIGEHGQ